MLNIVGDQGPSCIYQSKPVPPDRHREPTPISDQEKAWRELKPNPRFKPVKEFGFVAPINSLEGIEHTIARIEAIKRMTDSQMRDAATNKVLIEADKELSTIMDEFRANGFQAISLSSSESRDEDDDLEAANFAEKNLGVTPYAYGIREYAKRPDGTEVPIYRDAEELAPLMRRIEWERALAASSMTTKVRLTMQGGEIGAVAEFPATPLETVLELGKRLLALANPDWLANHHYATTAGFVGSALYGVKSGETIPEQSTDELGAEDLEEPEEVLQGPQELGLHNFADDEAPLTIGSLIIHQGPVESEPSQTELEEWSLNFTPLQAWKQAS